MGMTVKGITMRGLSIKGREILTPSQITSTSLISWHQWKTGFTLNSGNVSQWDDQSGNGYHLSQATASRQPAYDAGTGKITPDGTADYLMLAASTNFNGVREYTFVIEECTDPARSITFSRMRHGTTADGNNLNLSTFQDGQFYKSIAGGTGSPVHGIAVPAILSGKFVVSVVPGALYFNGAEGAYVVKSPGGWVDDATTPQRESLFARLRNSGGVFAQPAAYGTVPVYEWCHHNGVLTALERAKMVNYFKIKHGIA